MQKEIETGFLFTEKRKKQLQIFLFLWMTNTLSALPNSISELIRFLFLAFISTLILLYLTGPNLVLEKVNTDVINYLTLVIVALITLFLHLVFIAPYKACKQMKSMGTWKNDTFYYKKPIGIFSHITAEAGQFELEVIFPRECKNCFVNTKTIVDSAHSRVEAGFTCAKSNGKWHLFPSKGPQRAGIRLTGRKHTLIVNVDQGTIPTRIEVILESFQP